MIPGQPLPHIRREQEHLITVNRTVTLRHAPTLSNRRTPRTPTRRKSATARQGRTVLISSHLISEIAQTADALIVIGQGRLLAQTTVTRLSARGGSLEEAFFQLTGGVTDYSGRLS